MKPEATPLLAVSLIKISFYNPVQLISQVVEVVVYNVIYFNLLRYTNRNNALMDSILGHLYLNSR